MMGRILVAVNVVAAISCIALAGKYVIAPIVMKQIYAEDYKELVFSCDNVMREHLITKNEVRSNPSEESVAQLRAAEIGLVSCHDYDKMRKRLQLWGVTEAELALLGLEAIEEKAKDVRKFVEIHELRY